MASLSCKHRSSRAAYLVVILISRRLKGLAGDLGPSPFPRDVYARASREAGQGFFVSNPQCQSGGLENRCFCCIVRVSFSKKLPCQIRIKRLDTDKKCIGKYLLVIGILRVSFLFGVIGL